VSTTPNATTTSPATLQDIADQLTASLEREVRIHEGAPCPADDREDAGRPRSGSTPPFVVTVEGGGTALAHISVRMDGPRPLSPMDFEALDVASALVRDALSGGRGADRDSVLRGLLDDDESVRRDAYTRALRQRWIHRDGGTVVRALLVDAAVTDVQRVAFARHIAHMRPASSHFLALYAGTVMMVGQTTGRDVHDVVLREAARYGIRVLGIGTASPAPGADDLRGAADEAAIAASLAATLPQFHPAVDASELGGWLLLASASANPAHLHVISPAAHALYTQSEGSQRRTIETYLDVGANVMAACEILFLHRTTLYYRLERMPEIVREALDDGVKRSTLHIALKLIRLWEATGRV
jgi:hypothetical protein